MNTRIQRNVISVLLFAGLLGCKDLAGTPPLPAGTSSPGIVQNATGAVQTAAAATAAFQQAFADYIPVAGELTDELQANGRDDAITNGEPEVSSYTDVLVDARQLDQATDWTLAEGESGAAAASDRVYGALQTARGSAYQAIGGLAAYAPDSVVLRGEMYAALGYTEVMLADLFCSGVPLSTLDFQGGYTYQPSSTTAQVYSHAIALFDTAQSLAAANPQIVNLAKVGQGRAYLALGQYASAGTAVSAVPTTFQFIDSLVTCGQGGTGCNTTSGQTLQSPRFLFFGPYIGYSVSDREAGTGLPFISSGDPRTADTVVGTSDGGTAQQFFPKKYNISAMSPLLLASGVEAQLITAEADLNAGNVSGMFAILNALRQNNPATSSLPTLTDPGTFGAELDTLFTERAAWFFVDGHRQGDLRRLMRNYVNGQSIHVVANQYPSGDYGFGVGPYGSFIDAPIPSTELINPHFTGCVSRD